MQGYLGKAARRQDGRLGVATRRPAVVTTGKPTRHHAGGRLGAQAHWVHLIPARLRTMPELPSRTVNVYGLRDPAYIPYFTPEDGSPPPSEGPTGAIGSDPDGSSNEGDDIIECGNGQSRFKEGQDDVAWMCVAREVPFWSRWDGIPGAKDHPVPGPQTQISVPEGDYYLNFGMEIPGWHSNPSRLCDCAAVVIFEDCIDNVWVEREQTVRKTVPYPCNTLTIGPTSGFGNLFE